MAEASLPADAYSHPGSRLSSATCGLAAHEIFKTHVSVTEKNQLAPVPETLLFLPLALFSHCFLVCFESS
jgi:hypothetical protein